MDFYDGTSKIGSGTLMAASGGTAQATFMTSGLDAATSPHSITAVYEGDNNYKGNNVINGSDTAPQSTSISQVVNPAGTTVSVTGFSSPLAGTSA